MKFEAISPFDITCGEPLPFDVYTREGALLLSKGSPVNSDETRLYLLENATRMVGRKPTAGSAYVRMQRIADRLAGLERDYLERFRLEAWTARMRVLAREVVDVADEDHDAAFAAMHLDIHHSYDVVHQLAAGLICARLGLVACLTAAERTSLVCGALTHDLGLLESRPRVEREATLSGEGKALVEAHCQTGCRILRDLGVDDPLWLRLVEEHHERLDGSGYTGLTADRLEVPTRIMTLADSFSAMLRHRPYRDRLLASDALADLYNDSNGRYDQSLVSILVRELGLYPPGSVLRLASREVAIAIRATPGEIGFPVLAALFDPAGRPMYRASRRDARKEETSIVGLLPPEKTGAVRKMLPECWSGN